MHWLKDHWQVKLLAIALAIGLWLVIYLNPSPPSLNPNGGIPTARP
jgi:hypothetical protein